MNVVAFRPGVTNRPLWRRPVSVVIFRSAVIDRPCNETADSTSARARATRDSSYDAHLEFPPHIDRARRTASPRRGDGAAEQRAPDFCARVETAVPPEQAAVRVLGALGARIASLGEPAHPPPGLAPSKIVHHPNRFAARDVRARRALRSIAARSSSEKRRGRIRSRRHRSRRRTLLPARSGPAHILKSARLCS
jgi:hypothetical protein